MKRNHFTESNVTKFFARVSMGDSVKKASEHIGVPVHVIRYWISQGRRGFAKYTQFYAAYEHARETAASDAAANAPGAQKKLPPPPSIDPDVQVIIDESDGRCSEATAEEIASMVAMGATHSNAAGAMGIPRGTHYNWLSKGAQEDAIEPFKSYARIVLKAAARQAVMLEMREYDLTMHGERPADVRASLEKRSEEWSGDAVHTAVQVNVEVLDDKLRAHYEAKIQERMDTVDDG